MKRMTYDDGQIERKEGCEGKGEYCAPILVVKMNSSQIQLNAKPKANAVKQEQDKAEELKRGVLRTLLALRKIPEVERHQQVRYLNTCTP